jgi:hypothetical protein
VAAATFAALAVGQTLGAGDWDDPGLAVGAALCPALGLAVGLGVGLAVAGSGLGLALGLRLALGLGLGFGLVGAALVVASPKRT